MSIKKIQILTPIVTSVNGEFGDVTVNMKKLGIEDALAKKSDVNHTHDYAGSGEPGGSATSANKLTKDAGSKNQPVYFENGVPVKLPYSINKSIPANAIFTDTTYDIGTKTTAGVAKLYDSAGINSDGAMNQDATRALFDGKATTSKTVPVTLLASGWTGSTAPYTYNLSVAGVTAFSNQEIIPAANITRDQLISLQGTNMIDGGQSNGKIILKATKNKPTVDIPMRVILRGDAVQPVKGDLLNMDLGNGEKLYRVLRMDETIAECLAMNDISTSTAWGSEQWVRMGDLSVLKYADNVLDTYLNTTWYNTLSDTAKTAIISKNIDQDAWIRDATGSPVYTGTNGLTVPGTTNYTISKYAGGVVNVGDRNIYALSIQDIIDYLSDESVRVDKTAILRNVNIWKMFWNTTTKVAGSVYPWLRSVQATSSKNNAWIVGCSFGELDYLMCGYDFAGPTVRPAFQIDLSKIPFTKV